MYDAFISYGHDADSRIAPALRGGLERLAKPWWRRRSLHVFCDTTALSANPGLWSTITSAMDESGYFVLLASPDSAQSQWVGREIEYWRERRRGTGILLVLTGGELVWDNAIGDFDPVRSTALHPALRGAFAEEPLYSDLRFAHTDENLDIHNAVFLGAVAEIAAPMHGVAKDDLIGEDLKQHRRTRRVTWAAALTLAVLALATLVGAVRIQQQADDVLSANRSAKEAKAAQDKSETQANQADARRARAERGLGTARRAERAARALAGESNTRASAAITQQLAAEQRRRRQEALARAAQQDAANAQQLALASQESANRALAAATKAENDANQAVGEANAAIDETNQQTKAASRAAAAARSTSLAAAARDQDLMDSSLDLALLLANASSQVKSENVPTVPPLTRAAVTVPAAPAKAPSGARSALITTGQAAAGLDHYLQFARRKGPQRLDHVSVSPDGRRVAAVETSSSILLGESSSRLLVWREGRSPGDRAVDLSAFLERGDHLGCITQLEWDASGRYLLSVEHPDGCLNPHRFVDEDGNLIPGLANFVSQTVRIWDLAPRSGVVAETTAFSNTLALNVTSPLVLDSTRTVAVVQFPGGALRINLTNLTPDTFPNFFFASTLYGGDNLSPTGQFFVGGTINLAGTAFVPALQPVDGSELVLLDDPETQLSVEFDPLGDTLAAIVPGAATVKFFDPLTGAERTDLRKSFATDPTGIALGRPVVDGSPVDRLVVSFDSDAACTGTTAPPCAQAFNWRTATPEPVWRSRIVPPAAAEAEFAVAGIERASAGQRWITAIWSSPHELDDGIAIHRLVLDLATGVVRGNVDGDVAFFSAPDERYAVGQELDAEFNDETGASKVTIRARVWDFGEAGALPRTAAFVDGEKNVEAVAAPDRKSVAFVPTSAPVATGQERPVTILSLDPTAIDAGARTLPGARGTVHSIAFDRRGHLVGVGEATNGFVWDLAKRAYQSIDLVAETPKLLAAVNPDANLRAVTSDGKTLTFRCLDPGRATRVQPGPDLHLNPGEEIESLAFTPDSSLLGVILHRPTDEGPSLRHALTASVVARLEPGCVPQAAAPVTRFDGEDFVSSSGDGSRLALRRFALRTPLETDRVVVRSAADLSVLWNVDTGALAEDDTPSASNVFRLDWDGHRLGGTNGTARGVVWAQADGSHRTFNPGTEPAARLVGEGIAFSPDGQRLALSSPDKQVRLFDLTKPGTGAIVTRPIFPRSAARLNFSPDGEMLLVDGVYVMDGHSLDQLGPRLHAEEWNDPSLDLGTAQTFFTRDGQYVVATRLSGVESVRWPVGVEVLREQACAIADRNFTRKELVQFDLTPERQAARHVRVPNAETMCPKFEPFGR